MKFRGDIQNRSVTELGTYYSDTGSVNAYAIALSHPISSYTDGLRVSFKAANSNTGASTLAVDGLAAKSIKRNGTSDVLSGDIIAGQIITVVYDGTNFQLASGTGGSNGTSGTSGTTGTSGTSGTTGTSGTSGTNGTSGTSGSNGTSGTSGSSGTSGTSGTTGTSGTSGTTGTSGTSGTNGTSGTSGSNGTSGTSGNGTSGTSGSNGTSGTSGSNGTSGVSGTSGTTGTSGTSGTNGTSGTSGSSGTSGNSGTSGTSGTQGDKAGLQYTFSTTTTMADPGTGTVRFNNATPSSVTQIAVDDLDRNSVDHSNYIITWDDSTSTAKGFLTIRHNSNGTATSIIYRIDSLSDNVGWTQLNVSHISGTTNFSNSNNITLEFYRTGDTGTSGTSGTTGTSGTSGINGTSGTSGTNGTSGTSGNNGSNGTSGVSGTSGTSGNSGTSGTSGTTGTSGTSGTTGTSGTSGTTGTSGTSGAQGDKGGLQYTFSTTTTMSDPGTGTIRFNNATPASVTQIAVDDLDRNSVDVSNFILTFDDSSSAVKGFVTITHNSNGTATLIIYRVDSLSDNAGWTQLNVTHISGTTNFSNSAQIVVNFSRTGDTGSNGTSGTSGSSGTSGTSGNSGTSGTSGTNGTSGTSGTNGTSGTSGSNGSNGTSGVSGTSGTSGSNGASGTSGTSGSNGTSGTSGTNGTSGTSGTNGTNGTSGTSGSNGTSGTSGNSGTSGTSGSNGASGTSGTSGSSGTSGTSGNNGTSGTSGLNGIFGGDSHLYAFDDNYGNAPGTGRLGVDNSLMSAVTEIYVDFDNADAVDIETWLAAVVGNGRFRIFRQFDSSIFHDYIITGTDLFDATTYIFTVVHLVGNGSFSNNDDIVLSYAPPGVQGSAGTNGTSGTSGTTGTSGTSGTNGTSGVNGTSGTSGGTGSNGTSGTSGNSGTSGTSGNGTSGTSGTNGTSGTSGSNGSAGTSGTSGNTGTSGTSGTAAGPTIVLSAAGGQPWTSGGASVPAPVTMGTNSQTLLFLDFPDGSTTTAEWTIMAPCNISLSNMTARFVWAANSSSTNSVVWEISASATKDTEAIDRTLSTPVTVTDANGGTYRNNTSAATSTFTPAGYDNTGVINMVTFRVRRLGSDGSDTLAADARLLFVYLNVAVGTCA